jgi:hypothetical protein
LPRPRSIEAREHFAQTGRFVLRLGRHGIEDGFDGRRSGKTVNTELLCQESSDDADLDDAKVVVSLRSRLLLRGDERVSDDEGERSGNGDGSRAEPWHKLAARSQRVHRNEVGPVTYMCIREERSPKTLAVWSMLCVCQ